MGRGDTSLTVSIDPTSNDAELRRWMHACRLEDYVSTAQGIERLKSIGIPYDLLEVLWNQLPPALSELTRSDEGLARLVQYVCSSRSPQAVATLFERETTSLSTLLQAMALGPSISETLITDPEAFELLRITDGQPVHRKDLIDELLAEVVAARDEAQIGKTLRRYRQREVLRIAFGHFIRQIKPEESYRQLSSLAEAILQAAFDRARREIEAKCGTPMHFNGAAARCCVIALDRLGANQQGYDSSLKLLIIAETQGRTSATRIISNLDFFDRLSNCFLGYLSAQSASEEIYRIQLLKPLPINSESSIVDATAAFQHYDLRGRTWERQVFVQAQPIAGDLSLGEEFLQQLQPWVYRRYLSDSDVAGLGALQRKLQRKLSSDYRHRGAGIDDRRAAEDIEQMVLFLQLLHGHEYPDVRFGNTFAALDRLTEKHLLRDSERALLQSNYQIFRRAEAIQQLEGNLAKLQETTEQRRQINQAFDETHRALNARLEESFPESHPIPIETDLILDPQPEPGWIEGVLKPLGFANPSQAHQNLKQLSEENVAVLSTRRCRYFFSIIAPKLLRAIQATTDPDQTLGNLTRIAESIGGKGVLWELFSSNQATMELMVRLSAYSSYLASLLTQSPGMIDELMDSLLVDRLPRRDELEMTLAELCRETDDIDRVLHEFKNSMHLRVGVRDILGKESIVDTHRSLSDIAEVCIAKIMADEYRSLATQYGVPYSSTSNETQASYSFLALGKLGGQEPNYHSDLSCVLLFDQDGVTQHKPGSRANGTTVRHFFEQLAQRIMRRTNRINQYPRLFELDVRFGPLGKSGVLAMQLDQFVTYFKDGSGSVIERQSLCKARPIGGIASFSMQAMSAISQLIREIPFREEDRANILAYRTEVQSSASVHNLKRGEGGTFDIECLVQLLQLKHAHHHPEILVPGTLDAISMLGRFNIFAPDETKLVYQGYHFLREIEAGIRLMNMTSRHDLPDAVGELNRLAVLLGWKSGQALQEKANEVRSYHRNIFDRYTAT